MAGITKVVKFSEGVSTTQPLTTFISTTSYAPYANDAAFVTAKGSAATDGDSYYNTTLDLVRVYSNGSWTSLVDESTAQTISGVKTYSSVIISSNTTQSTDKDTGAIVTEGGVGIEKDLYVGGSAVITGDLTVNGTTTTISTTNLEVEDSNVTVNSGGNTATADANDAGLRVDLSDGTDCQLMFDSTATSKFKIGQVGSESEVATLSLAQVFTNKTFDDAKTEKHISTPSNPAAGYVKTYVKNDNKIYTLSSAGTEKAIGGTSAWTTALAYGVDDTVMHTDQEIYRCIFAHTSGTFLTDQASGYWVRLSEVDQKNINLNPVAESGTTGYTTYVDTGAIPTDMTGGSPNVTWTRNTTLPLGGVSDFLFTKDAANRQGEGVALVATMPKSLFAKNIQISFDYTVASGTYSDGDLIVYCYDVTNSKLLEPVNISIASVATALPSKHIATFQTSLTGTSYRIGFHVASTSTSAYTLQFRNIYIGEQATSYGAVVTDWKSYTPTGNWTTNTTYTAQYRRVGDSLEVIAKIALAGAPGGTSTFNMTLPSGLVIDTTKALDSVTDMANFGSGSILDSGAADLGPLLVRYDTTTTIGLANASTGAAGNLQFTNATAPVTFASGDRLWFTFKVPIVGWSSNVALSSDAGDGREVSVIASGATATVTGTLSDITWTTINKDNLGTFNGVTFTAPVSGEYRVSAQVRVNDSTPYGLNQATTISILKNGTEVATGQHRTASGFTAAIPSVVHTLSLIKGDTVKIQVSANSTAPTMQSGTVYNILAIEKINPGSQRLAATETIEARYEHTAGQAIASASTPILDYSSKINDTHNAVTTGASWKFTAPISGLYEISAFNRFASASFTALNNCTLQLFKNGSIYSFLDISLVQTSATTKIPMKGSDTVRLLAGEYIDVRVSHDEAASRSLESSAGNRNYLNIKRIGN